MKENKHNLPLISVIVPAYNSELFLGKTIDCIRKQTYHATLRKGSATSVTYRQNTVCQQENVADHLPQVCLSATATPVSRPIHSSESIDSLQ